VGEAGAFAEGWDWQGKSGVELGSASGGEVALGSVTETDDGMGQMVGVEVGAVV
jgi:hypothetical protein